MQTMTSVLGNSLKKIQINHFNVVQSSNNSTIPNKIKHAKNTFDEVVSQFTTAIQSSIWVKTEGIPNIIPIDKADKVKPIDIHNSYFVTTQDINKCQREKSNVSLAHAGDEIMQCSATQIIHARYEKEVTIDSNVTDCEFKEINRNKPPKGERIQDEMAKQVINLDSYKKDKQPIEDMAASEDLPIQIKMVERVVPNNIGHVTNTFDDVVSQFTIALQSSIGVNSKDTSNIILTDKGDKINHIDVHDNYFVATQDINKDQSEKSNVSLAVAFNADNEDVTQFNQGLKSSKRVQSKEIPNIIPNATQDITKDHTENSNVSSVPASKADDEVVLCSVDGNVKNEQGKNENTYCGSNFPSQENIDDASYAMLKNVSDSSDDESTPKKTKRLTFTDSDFPDDDENRDILMLYPKPAVIESCSESESDNSSEDENYSFRRFRNKPEPETKIDLNRLIGIENLPDRVMTRLRNSALIFKPIYLKEQEDNINEDIILENIKRLKSFKEAKTCKGSKNHESVKQEKKETTPRKKTDKKRNERKRKVKVKIGNPKRKGKKSKSRKNTKEGSSEVPSTSAIKTTTRITRSAKKENDGSNTQNKCIFPEKKYKKPNHKRKPYKRTICSKIEQRQSKRQQKANEKNDDTMKALIPILKKSKPKRSTVYNGPSSSSESPKGLKRLLDDDSDVSTTLKRTRSHNSNNNSCLQNTLLRVTPASAMKSQHLHLTAFADKEHKLDKLNPYVYLERYEPAQKRIKTLNTNRKFMTRSQYARKRYHRACKRTRVAARTSTKRLYP